MAPSQGARSSCWGGETAAGYEHHSSSSPEESSSASDNETPSDSTLNEEDEDDERLSSVTGSEPSHGADVRCPTFFPFHLISGCSSAGRSMTSSRSLTSQEVKTVLGLRGMSRLVWVWMHQWTPHAMDPGSVIAPTPIREHLHATMQELRRDTLEPG
jgi:hypothetical protein